MVRSGVRVLWFAILGAFALVAVACTDSTVDESAVTQPDITQPGDPDTSSTSTGTSPSARVECDRPVPTIRTDVQRSGNRVAAGTVDFDRPVIDIDLGDVPRWVVPHSESSWYVVLESGLGLIVGSDGTMRTADGPPSGEPPELLVSVDDELVVASALRDHDRFDDPLPDTRVVTSGSISAALVGPTDRYAHGVLGDAVEAGAIEIVDRCDGTRQRITVEAPDVIEGISPMLVDLDADGVVEVVVTIANDATGARIAAFELDGSPLAESDPIGQGNRWRHQLGAGVLAPDGVLELVDVRIPHIGGVVEFLRLEGNALVVAAEASPFTSHVLGSRNLDMGLLVDTTGDDRPDVVLVTQDRRRLVSLTRQADGVEQVGEVLLEAELTTNVAVDAPEEGGEGAIAVGTADGRLLIVGG